MLICPAIDSVFSHQWPVKKTPRSNTLSQMPASGRGPVHIPLYQFPLWDFEWILGYIPGNAGGDTTVYQILTNFLVSVQNSGQAFLFLDPYDNSVTAQEIGVGDGTTTQFTMYRTFLAGGGQDLIQNFVNPPNIYLNGVLKTVIVDYSIDQYGTITFTSPVPNTYVITWTGSFYFQVRMKKDSQDSLQSTMYQIWELKSFAFESELN